MSPAFSPVSVVLCSGGLDSAVLLADEAQRGEVIPVHVSVGLAWEAAEIKGLERLLAASALHDVQPLARLHVDMRDVYAPTHWAVRGAPPAYDTPDEDVYIPGRNLVLLTKAGVFAGSRRATRIVLGTLAGNPFPDATPKFFDAVGHALSVGLDFPIAIDAPFAGRSKADVIQLGVSLGVPLELTLSCMNPPRVEGDVRHCGLCSKCRERRDAFVQADVADSTSYAHPSPR